MQAKKCGLKSGEAWDLTTGWDFNLEAHRKQAENYIDEQKPRVVIGSPPCTPFSQPQTLNSATVKSQRKWQEGVEHMKFVIHLYKIEHIHTIYLYQWLLVRFEIFDQDVVIRNMMNLTHKGNVKIVF